MIRILGLVLTVAGIILIIYGVRASESFTSEVSEFFTGTPTDKTMGFLIGGIASAVGGIAMLLFGSRVKG